MTYSSGGLIQATDYNGFVSTTAGANVNAVWNSTYGQTALSTVAVTNTVTATQWATLNNTISSMGNHQATTITSRTNPVAGNTIAVLSNINSDLTNIYNNRYNAYASGSQYTGWSGTTNIGAKGPGTWTATFTHVVNFANNTSFNNFFNSGGIIKIQFGKTSTGAFADAEWNAFIGNGTGNGVVSILYQTGVATSKTIASIGYTGLLKTGGTGTPTTYATAIGAFALTTSNQILYKQFDVGTGYTANYVQVQALVDNATPTQITYTTTWVAADANPGATNLISGGTAPTGVTFGTAPATIVSYFPPESVYLTPNWGTPTISASVA